MTINGVAGNSFSPYTSIAPTTATSATSGVASTSGTVRDEAVEYSWARLSQLTSSDRSLIAAAAGAPVPTRESGASPIAPIFAFQVASDREHGALAAGESIGTDYINNLIKMYDGQDDPFGGALNRALEYLYSDNKQDSVDLLA